MLGLSIARHTETNSGGNIFFVTRRFTLFSFFFLSPRVPMNVYVGTDMEKPTILVNMLVFVKTNIVENTRCVFQIDVVSKLFVRYKLNEYQGVYHY